MIVRQALKIILETFCSFVQIFFNTCSVMAKLSVTREQIALNPNDAIAEFCRPLPLEAVYQPDPQKTAFYMSKRAKFAELYRCVKEL
ncbi:MAG TPA: hypothetical protein DD638_06390 [Pasteurellaceae bacterium]|nr:hypothetical protein [Pasteurellaceae bacterium]